MGEAGEADEAIFFVGGDVVGCEGYGGGGAAEHAGEGGARVGLWGWRGGGVCCRMWLFE